MLDPATISLILNMLKTPQGQAAVAGATSAITQPGAVDVDQMRQSPADLAKGILACYHKTGRFRSFDVLSSPYDKQNQYAAENSAVIRINFLGSLTSNPYFMDVAVMTKGDSVRTSVIGENTYVLYNDKCELENWVSMQH